MKFNKGDRVRIKWFTYQNYPTLKHGDRGYIVYANENIRRDRFDPYITFFNERDGMKYGVSEHMLANILEENIEKVLQIN